MKSSERTAPVTLGQLGRAASPRRKATTGVLQCLVSSANQARRNVLSQAATDAGWETVVCSPPDSALGVLKRDAFHFAMVDLDDHGQTPAGARELVQTLTEDSKRILVGVCGHEADPEEEIWVRTLGVWLYLPGLTSTTEVSLLCEQALEVVSRKRLDEKKASTP